MNQVTLSYLLPFGFIHNFNGIGSYSNNIMITSSQNLTTSEGLYCVQSSSNGIVYVQTNLINTNTISCQLNKTQFINNIDIVNIWLFLNASNNITQQFNMSNNYISFIFLRQSSIYWNVYDSVINYLTTNITLNYIIPNFYPSLQYSITQTTQLGSITQLNCDFNDFIIPNCLIQNSYSINPILLNYTFTLTYITGNTLNAYTNSLTYYELTNIITLYPYILSYVEYKYQKQRIIISTDISINSNYNYICLCKKKFLILILKI